MSREAIGARIRRIRLERGLRQHELAAPGVSGAYISRIEKGDRTPSVSAIRVIAQRLDVSPEYLETGLSVPASEERRSAIKSAELELRLGRNVDAVEQRLERVLADARDAADVDAEAAAAAALGLLNAHRGRHEEAVRQLEVALESERSTPSGRPDLYATLARSYAVVGRNENAVDVLEGALGWLREHEPENAIDHVRFATYLSYALTDIREYERARDAIETAIARGAEAADPYTRVRLYWSQARLATAENDHIHAKGALERAVALLEVVDDSLHLGRAHRLWAETLLDEDRVDEAREHLGVAASLLTSSPEAKDEALYRIELARLQLLQGESSEAIGSAERALELSRDDGELRARAEWVLGAVRMATGEPEIASEHYSRAAETIGLRSRYRRRILREWAELLEREGSLDEAFSVLRELVLEEEPPKVQR